MGPGADHHCTVGWMGHYQVLGWWVRLTTLHARRSQYWNITGKATPVIIRVQTPGWFLVFLSSGLHAMHRDGRV